jgi:predicted acylesterase/phospholipase RssA
MKKCTAFVLGGGGSRGALCNLPIEPALQMGATEIIALDLNDATLIPKDNLSLVQYFEQYLFATNRRHIQLETHIAEMQGVPVRSIDFQGMAKTPMWDFSDYRALRQAGYEKAKKVIAEWNEKPQTKAALSAPANDYLFA